MMIDGLHIRVRPYYIHMKFYLETYGCKLNEADSEILRGLLSEEYEEVFDTNNADFIILNTCGVIDKTEKKIIDKTKYFQNQGKSFLTGCLPLITKIIFPMVEWVQIIF